MLVLLKVILRQYSHSPLLDSSSASYALGAFMLSHRVGTLPTAHEVLLAGK